MIAYYSTNRSVPEVDLAQALLQGQAGDRGLFMPCPLPRMGNDFLKNVRSLSYPGLATEVLAPYTEGLFSRDALQEICHDAYTFPVPIETVCDRTHVVRLDQGPTASFKDFAAQFMARTMGQLVKQRGRDLLILTATSGDTGSAIARAFFGIPRIQVVILFPLKEVSERQRKQMTTLGGNVTTLALDGKFDDCQALVKRAFGDGSLSGLNLSSANSINIGRLLPQSIYYIYAAGRLADIGSGEQVVFSVPSGNFGDLMGGILAFKSGLPVKKFVVATNANDEVPQFLKSGRYAKIVPSRECISNAMNVGHPSNLARLVDVYGGQLDEKGALHKSPNIDSMRHDLFAVSIGDEETRATMRDVYQTYGTVLEPHGAVGWAGLRHFREQHPGSEQCICLETAHPAKFPEEIRALTGREPPVPPSLEGIEDKRELHHSMETDYRAFKEFLQKNYGGQ